MKKLLLLTLTIVLLSVPVYAQNPNKNASQNEILFSKLKQLSQQQLLDTADYYFNRNSYDSALICYKLIINAPVSVDREQHVRVIEAINKTVAIYYYLGDYRTAYRYAIDALILCEKQNLLSRQYKFYNTIGNIYLRFKELNIAKSYYNKAINTCEDSTRLNYIYNNLGICELDFGNYDSAFYYLNKALQSWKRSGIDLCCIYNNIASIYHDTKRYDSAYYYYQLSLSEERVNSRIYVKVQTLSDLGKLFFDMNQHDSAKYYINLSITIAAENKLLRNIAENYLILSEIEESKGNIKKAFEYYKIQAAFKDSILSTSVFSDISQLQNLYEIRKTDQQIEQLILEQHIKERTIHLQKIIWFITLVVLILVSIGLWYIYIQKRNLNISYKLLFEKNIEIIESQKQETQREKYLKSALNNSQQNELLNRILVLMDDVSTFSDADFSLEQLAELAQSNTTYVSLVINNVLKQNFRSFLNTYRVREAQRLFSEPDAEKYTIESVSLRVGFKSQNTFYIAFKEITGVTPKYYLKSIQARNSAD